MPTELEKAALRVTTQWGSQEANISISAVIKAEMLASWPDLYHALESLNKQVTSAILRGDYNSK